MTADILASCEWFEAVEDYLDDHVAPRFGCPNPECGETHQDNLVWHNVDLDEADYDEARPEFVRCSTCGTEYEL